MLTKIIEFSVRNKLIIGLFVLALIGVGIYQATKLPIDAVPDITNNQVQIITTAPALGATDIERLITFPIEQVNSNIEGIHEIRSFSRFGLSLVTIVFDDAIDVYWARQQVAERLQQVQSQIPKGVGTPTLGPISSGLGEIYQYVVKPKKGYEQQYDATALRTIQDWIIRRQLLGVPGVAEVSSFGGKLKQYEIAINPNKLNSYHISIDDVFKAIAANNQNTGGAYIEKGPTVLFIRSEGLITNKTDIENIAIKQNSEGTSLMVRDVAEVKIGYATRYGAMCYNDEGEVAGAIVMMLKGANSSEVIKKVKERVTQIQKTLPEGIVLEPFLDRTKMVNNAISTVEQNLLEGALIVVFVLVLFLGNFRAGLLVASVIPLAMLFAISMMNLFSVSGNLMSLGALDFGLIVDGAVIIVEAVMHQLMHQKKNSSNTLTVAQMDHQVTQSASKMMNSAVFGQIIILIVYLPIFTLQGIEGKMFKPMAQTVAFALLGAFILSLTYIPMMSALVLSKKTTHKQNFSDRLMAAIERTYQKVLLKVLRIPTIILGAVVGLFVLAVVVLTSLGGEFIPALEEGDFAVDTRVLTGSNLNTTIDYTQKAAHILKTRFPEVEKVVTKIGSGEVPTDPMPMEASDMMVVLKDKKYWTSATNFDDLSAKMSKALQDVPGITASFQYPVQMRFNELMTGARQDVVCKIFGENLDSLAATAEKLGKIVNTVAGTKNLYVETVTGMPQIIIEYNRPVIAQYNLSIEAINNVVNTAFAGQSTGLVFEDEKRFDLVVRLDASQKQQLEDVQNLLIPTPNGNQIPLRQLATVSIKDGPNQIQREDAKRRIVVGFNVRGRDVQSIVTELQQKVNAQLKTPIGYYITYGGSFENLNKAKARLMIAVPISLLLIFILLFFAFKSVKQGLLIYTAIPLSAIGGIFFLALRGMPFSISAGVGFIALFGVAVLNGIVLIAEFNRLKLSGMKNLLAVVVKGTTVRLRPVLMTAFVASLGFLPMALSNGAGAEVQRPLATVVIGGLMIATFLTLFVLPILYIIFENGLGAKPKQLSKITALLCLVLFSTYVQAQQPIDLKTATQIAVNNNLLLKEAQQKITYAGMMMKTANIIPNTNVLADVGQINSSFTDTKFAITQTLNFPIVYKKQQQLLTAEWDLSKLSKTAKEVEIKKLVATTFYEYLYLQQQQQTLASADSMYQALLNKATLRLQKGESNILEKATFQNQYAAIQTQRNQVAQALHIAQFQLQYLLQTDTLYMPTAPYKAPAIVLIDTAIGTTPYLQLLAQQKKIQTAVTAVEKSKLAPDLLLGYSNGSIRGVGADNKLYTASQRFNSVQVGLGIPLFNAAQKAKVKASKFNETVVDATINTEKAALQLQLKTAMEQYKKSMELLAEFENGILKNNQLIYSTALKQFNSGDINYLDFVQLINQCFVVTNQYTSAVKAYNDAVITLQYLTASL
ncbi:CusA/CzcA family heavy metal efflux RND transporter [Ferruginibacter yonginensis]|uniref:CusA/CzcA family heavy metal efflux RND transporter n=1 Tax=Ferruginibacter yonginensis TaxID=1310416 RepID=A0ABV8QX34_9BACT